MDTQLKIAQGNFNLQRLPFRKNEQLRAWDAADEYLFAHLAENKLLIEKARVLILNDGFGALAVALNKYNPIIISDSFLSQQATLKNLLANGFDEQCVQLRSSLDWPDEQVDLVLIKVPKTLAYFEDQLIRLQPLLTKNTTVIASGMVKAMSASVWKLMTKYLGETKPSQAKKKARLIFVDLMTDREVIENPYPVSYQLEETEYQIVNHANVFSRESLDIGTRFLLKYLPKNSGANDIVDLGCGNGVVGLMLAEFHPLAKLYFVDESYMAVASAKQNFNTAFVDREAEFLVTNGLETFKPESMDLIVCNPPFHQQNTVGNQIASSMFKQSYQVLRKGGVMLVIGNRHLGYHLDLKRLFGECVEVASNTKFVIWRATK